MKRSSLTDVAYSVTRSCGSPSERRLISRLRISMSGTLSARSRCSATSRKFDTRLPATMSPDEMSRITRAKRQ